jgi:hypothetical protein
MRLAAVVAAFADVLDEDVPLGGVETQRGTSTVLRVSNAALLFAGAGVEYHLDTVATLAAARHMPAVVGCEHGSLLLDVRLGLDIRE